MVGLEQAAGEGHAVMQQKHMTAVADQLQTASHTLFSYLPTAILLQWPHLALGWHQQLQPAGPKRTKPTKTTTNTQQASGVLCPVFLHGSQDDADAGLSGRLCSPPLLACGSMDVALVTTSGDSIGSPLRIGMLSNPWART